MTGKRFRYNVNKNCIEYDGKFVAYMNSVDGCRIANYWNGLYKENEQLKKENYELHKRLGDFEPFERYMKEITSKTSLEDIIGIVKTDEPTNSVELKKELYK